MQPAHFLARLLLGTLAGGSLLVACSTTQAPGVPPRLSAAIPGALEQCDALQRTFSFPATRLETATRVTQETWAGQSVPPYCLVKGLMHERQGADGRTYAIRFEMRLPERWNGRFFHQGNGGLDGVVQPALGALGGGPVTSALMQGFAVISSDAGHTSAQLAIFGFEPQARRDFGYEAVAKVTPMAKQLIQAGYGRGPDRSYMGGCSNGGRHTLVAAARLGEHYDGYLAGAPGHNVAHAALANMQAARLWLGLQKAGEGNPAAPDPALSFTPQERQIVASAVLARCDALDGAVDGMVQATQACQAQFDLQRDVPTCQGERNGQCLSTAQKQVAVSVFAGVKTARGQSIYSSYPYDPGLSAPNWASWKFVESVVRNPLSVGTVFSVPPGRLDLLTDDFDLRLARLQASDEVFSESGLQMVGLPNEKSPANLSLLRDRGAKVIVYHGVSDPIFSADDTRRWVQSVYSSQAGKGADFLRYFPVPGMTHCTGGPATDQFDLLGSLVAWVEQGKAPDSVVAQVRGAGNQGGVNADVLPTWSAARSRPLCAYPATAVYKGSGSIEHTENFACR